MEVDTKYKRWGWGAVIGLIGLILVAGLIIAVTMSSSPKPEVASDDTKNDSTSAIIDNEGNNSGDNGENNENTGTEKQSGNDSQNANSGAENNKETGNSSSNSGKSNSGNDSQNQNSKSGNSGAKEDLPKTGPESAIFAIVAAAISGALIAYNFSLTSKRA